MVAQDVNQPRRETFTERHIKLHQYLYHLTLNRGGGVFFERRWMTLSNTADE